MSSRWGTETTCEVCLITNTSILTSYLSGNWVWINSQHTVSSD